MYIEQVPNRNSPPAILLRESYRQGKTVRKRTLANLTKWPKHLIDGLLTLLRGGTAVDRLEETFEVVRSRPHGHIACAMGIVRQLGLERMLAPTRSQQRDLVVAMMVARIVEPRSKLATARGLREETQCSSLAELLGIEQADEDDLYAAMDWLLTRQEPIEQALARRHLSEGSLVLYDVTSTYFEGHCCPLAQYGHPRDKPGKLQIIFGLLCNQEGCPVAVEVFEGNTGDPATLKFQVKKLRERFGLERVVWVGDRGMLTEARIREDLQGVEGLDWISALRAPAIRQLVKGGLLQLSLFDKTDLAEIHSPDYSGERLVVCKNPLLAEERARKRKALLQATEVELKKVVEATQRHKRRLKGKDQIGLRVGKVFNRFKVAKHFDITITEEGFSYERNIERISQEAALDGLYVIRTRVSQAVLSAEQTVGAYKGLAVVERAFRSYKTVDLKVRPIYHYLADRVRAHVFLCMLAYYVEWHMRQKLAPMLFDDEDKALVHKQRASIVAPAQPSPKARRKARTKRTDDGYPVHSFHTLLADLATIVKNRIQPTLPGVEAFDQITRPSPLQQRALDLLGVRL